MKSDPPTDEERRLMQAAAAARAGGLDEADRLSEFRNLMEEMTSKAEKKGERRQQTKIDERAQKSCQIGAFICASAATWGWASRWDESRMLFWMTAFALAARALWIAELGPGWERSNTLTEKNYSAVLKVSGVIFQLGTGLALIALGLTWMLDIRTREYPALGTGMLAMASAAVTAAAATIWRFCRLPDSK